MPALGWFLVILACVVLLAGLVGACVALYVNLLAEDDRPHCCRCTCGDLPPGEERDDPPARLTLTGYHPTVVAADPESTTEPRHLRLADGTGTR